MELYSQTCINAGTPSLWCPPNTGCPLNRGIISAVNKGIDKFWDFCFCPLNKGCPLV